MTITWLSSPTLTSFFWFHPRCCFSCTFSVHWLQFPCCSVSDRDIILHTASLDWGQISLGRRNHQPQGGWPSLFSLVGDPPALNLNSDLLLVLGNWLILLYTICSKTKVSIYVDRIFPSNFFFMYSFFWWQQSFTSIHSLHGLGFRLCYSYLDRASK